MQLPEPKVHSPIQKNRYEVAAGLKNIEAHACRFEIDREFPVYREAVLAARAERLTKYYPEPSGMNAQELAQVTRFIAGNLASGYPQFFTLRETQSGFALDCALTGEKIAFHRDFTLDVERTSSEVEPPYRDSFDAVSSQIQEDLAIWRASDPKVEREWLAVAHLCCPNHWAAEDKVGRSFKAVHVPVAHFDVLSHGSRKIVEFMIQKGNMERFAWGVGTDRRLNHHPVPNPNLDASEWAGRSFDPEHPALFLRYERQTLTAFPELCASLFTIRTYFKDVSQMPSEEKESLALAIESMSPESLEYKGLTRSKSDILVWLRARHSSRAE